MFPYDINSARDSILHIISKKLTSAITNKPSFQQLIDEGIPDEYTVPVPLTLFTTVAKLNNTYQPNSLTKSDLPSEKILMENDNETDKNVTLLLPRRLKNAADLKAGVICVEADEITTNQDLLKLSINIELLLEAGFNSDSYTHLALAKYIAYFLLSTRGKKMLHSILSDKHDEDQEAKIKTLQVQKLLQLHIPLPVNLAYIVQHIDDQILDANIKRYEAQFENSDQLFKAFNDIITLLKTNKTITYVVDTTHFTLREFGLCLTHYLMKTPQYDSLNIGVMLESLIHYKLFTDYEETEWEDTPVEFYAPNHEIDEEDVVIVIKQFENTIDIAEGTRVIILEEAV